MGKRERARDRAKDNRKKAGESFKEFRKRRVAKKPNRLKPA
jgi:hypothetical protein